MTNYKLLFFNTRVRGEPARLIFAEAGVEYEDKRFEESEWPEIQPTTPFGKVPVLYIDDKPPLAQSGAIVAYLGREFGLDAGSPLADAYAHMLFKTFDDVGMLLPYLEEDPVKKAELTEEALEEHINPVLARMEKDFKAGGNDFLVGKKLTYVDLGFWNFCDIVSVFDKTFLTKFPTLDALCKRVAARPNIKKYLENRPPTPF
ncbi:hematopoietic prostaglandin D synthase-like [Clavelina lepadiformis]|uniref:glutathione transferase n=1 Tax=Clavelina lepadiformis TaxID=159417 RepID=A0ABP0F4B1_CLALP